MKIFFKNIIEKLENIFKKDLDESRSYVEALHDIGLSTNFQFLN